MKVFGSIEKLYRIIFQKGAYTPTIDVKTQTASKTVYIPDISSADRRFITGPDSDSTTDRLVAFDGTTGGLVKDSGKTTSDFATSTQGSNSDNHIAASSNVHGVGSGNSVVGTNTTQTLQNKTIERKSALGQTTCTISSNIITPAVEMPELTITSGTGPLNEIAPASGSSHTDGRLRRIYNALGSDLTIKHATGTAGNTFFLPGNVDFILKNQASIDLMYTSSGWALVDASAEHRLNTSNPHSTSASQVGAIATTVMTTLGDTLYGGASGVATRLSGNTTTTKKFLRETGDGANAAAPAWDTVTKADVGLSNVTDNAQIKGLGVAPTSGNFVSWGTDGYTVADSTKSASSFEAAGNVSTHAGLTTGVHGVGAGAIVGTTLTQTISNKTLGAITSLDSETITAASTLTTTSGKPLQRITSGSGTIYGIDNVANGKLYVLVNETGSDIILGNDSTATDAYRIFTGTGADFTLKSGASAILIYDSGIDGGVGKWVLAGGAGSSGGGLTVVVSSSGTITCSSNTHYLVDCSSANRHADLPDGVSGSKVRFSTFGNTSNSYRLTIDASSGSDKINYYGVDYDDVQLLPVNGWAELTWDGTKWRVDDQAQFVSGTFAGDLGMTGKLTVDHIGEKTSSHGIIFDNGIKLPTSGGTAATLSHYEDGTFSPTWIPATGSFGACTYVRTGRFIRIGKQVTVWIKVYCTAYSAGTASGNLFVGTLPYICSSTDVAVCSITTSGWGTTTAPQIGYLAAGDNKVQLKTQDSADSRDNSNTAVQVSALGAYCPVTFTLTYAVD